MYIQIQNTKDHKVKGVGNRLRGIQSRGQLGLKKAFAFAREGNSIDRESNTTLFLSVHPVDRTRPVSKASCFSLGTLSAMNRTSLTSTDEADSVDCQYALHHVENDGINSCLNDIQTNGPAAHDFEVATEKYGMLPALKRFSPPTIQEPPHESWGAFVDRCFLPDACSTMSKELNSTTNGPFELDATKVDHNLANGHYKWTENEWQDLEVEVEHQAAIVRKDSAKLFGKSKDVYTDAYSPKTYSSNKLCMSKLHYVALSPKVHAQRTKVEKRDDLPYIAYSKPFAPYATKNTTLAADEKADRRKGLLVASGSDMLETLKTAIGDKTGDLTVTNKGSAQYQMVANNNSKRHSAPAGTLDNFRYISSAHKSSNGLPSMSIAHQPYQPKRFAKSAYLNIPTTSSSPTKSNPSYIAYRSDEHDDLIEKHSRTKTSLSSIPEVTNGISTAIGHDKSLPELPIIKIENFDVDLNLPCSATSSPMNMSMTEGEHAPPLPLSLQINRYPTALKPGRRQTRDVVPDMAATSTHSNQNLDISTPNTPKTSRNRLTKPRPISSNTSYLHDNASLTRKTSICLGSGCMSKRRPSIRFPQKNSLSSRRYSDDVSEDFTVGQAHPVAISRYNAGQSKKGGNGVGTVVISQSPSTLRVMNCA